MLKSFFISISLLVQICVLNVKCITSNSINDLKNSIPITAKVLISQSNLIPMVLILSTKISKGEIVDEGEIIGSLKKKDDLNLNSEHGIIRNNEKIDESDYLSLISPCKAQIQEIYYNSNSVIAAENINGEISPKYILSLLCLEIPSNSLLNINKKIEIGREVIEVELASRKNAIITDISEHQSIEKGNLIIGMWFDTSTYVRYEATEHIEKIRTTYPRSQILGNKFETGLSLISFQIEHGNNEIFDTSGTQILINDSFDKYNNENFKNTQEESSMNNLQLNEPVINHELSLSSNIQQNDQVISNQDQAPLNDISLNEQSINKQEHSFSSGMQPNELSISYQDQNLMNLKIKEFSINNQHHLDSTNNLELNELPRNNETQTSSNNIESNEFLSINTNQNSLSNTNYINPLKQQEDELINQETRDSDDNYKLNEIAQENNHITGYSEKEDENTEYDHQDEDSLKKSLMNSALTYSIMMRNHLKKTKLQNVNKHFDFSTSKSAKWTIRSPCSGTLVTNVLKKKTLTILQGTYYAQIKCNKKIRNKKKSNGNENVVNLIMPFSIKIKSIKVDLQSVENTEFISAEVSKNQIIISGILTNESKMIPSYLLYGNFQLITAPCQGVLKIFKKIGDSLEKKDKIFSIDCTGSKENTIMYGIAIKKGLLSYFFKNNESNVKTGEAVAIVRNNWRILTSPCEGLLVYTDAPGLAKVGKNIAVVICNDNEFKKKNIEATKSFMILQNMLPNPSFVKKKQPLVIVDASDMKWEDSDYVDNSNAILKVVSPNNSKNNVLDQKCKFNIKINLFKLFNFNFQFQVPENVIIQNIISPCNGILYRRSNHKIGSKIREKKILANIKCKNKKSYILKVSKSVLVLFNNVYDKEQQLNQTESFNSKNLPEYIQVSKGEQIFQVLFIHNVKYHVISAPCTGFGYTFNSIGTVSKGKYFAAIQCKDEESEKKTQKIKAIKDMHIVSTYISFKKKFYKGDALFIMIES